MITTVISRHLEGMGAFLPDFEWKFFLKERKIREEVLVGK